MKNPYREKSKYYHPDFGNVPKNISEAMMKLLNEAADTLLDTEKKKRYDAFWDATFKGQKCDCKQKTTLAKPEDVEIKDYYNALNISRNKADESTIRNAYLAVLNQFRSQLQGENSEMARQVIAYAEEAYGVLSHKETKALYDSQYDKVYLAKVNETPRVHGEITVVRPKTTYPAYQPKKEAATVTVRQNTKLSAERSNQREVATYKTTRPIVQVQKNSSITIPCAGKNELISIINAQILSKKLSMPKAIGKKIYIEDLYAILSEDHSFQFAKERDEFYMYEDEIYYFLASVPGNTALTEEYKSEFRPWNKQEIVTLRGVKSIVIPAIKLLPTQLISIGGLFDKGDYIIYDDLCATREEILTVLSQNPNMIDAFFGKDKSKRM